MTKAKSLYLEIRRAHRNANEAAKSVPGTFEENSTMELASLEEEILYDRVSDYLFQALKLLWPMLGPEEHAKIKEQAIRRPSDTGLGPP